MPLRIIPNILPVWVFGLLLAMLRAEAQAPIPYAVHYLCEEKDALPSDIITGVTQDNRGVMWFAAIQKGLVRYDGVRMTLVPSSRRGKIEVLDNRYYGLAKAPDGLIWVATRFGVERFDPRTNEFRPVSSPGPAWDIYFEAEANAVLLDDRGNMWVAFGACLLMFEQCDPQKPVLIACINPGYLILQISLDERGEIWIAAAENQIFRVKNGRIEQEKYLYLQRDGSNIFVAFQHDEHGRLTGFYCPKIGKYIDLLPDGTLKPQIPSNAISRESLQKEWDKYKYLAHIVANQAIYYDIGLRVYKDPQGRSWAFGIGIFVLSPIGLSYSTHPHFADIEFRGMLEQADRSVLMCTYNGIFRYFQDTRRLDTLVDYISVCRHPMAVWDDELILLTEGRGIFTYNLNTKDVARNAFGLDSVGRHSSFLAYTVDKNGRYWIGNPQMGYLKQGQKRWFTDPKWHLPLPIEVRALYLDDQGVFWVGTESGLYTFTEKEGWGPLVLSKEGELHAKSRINYVWKDASGIVWIGTMYQGLLKFDPARREVLAVYNEKKGLGNNITFINAEDAGKILWVVCFDGIYQLEVATGKTVRFSARRELPVQEFNHAATLKLRDGAYLAGGIGGCICFMPGKGLFQHDIPVFPVISQINLLSSRRPDTRTIEFPENQCSITVQAHENTIIVMLGNADYAVPFLQKKHAVLLEGFDKDWTVLQGVDQFRYTNLPVGKYVLRIKLMDRNNLEGSLETRINILIQEHFYKSNAFKLLLLGAIFLLAYLAYLYRVRQIRNEQRFRLNLSSNLHDELGGILFKINHLAHEIADKAGADPEVRKKAGLLTDFCRKTYQAMGDIIWSLNIDKQTVGDLLDRMQDNVDAMLKSDHIPVRFQADNLHLHKKLNINVRHHILMIFKECLTNIVKHTKPHMVQISLRNVDGVFIMKVENTYQDRRDDMPSGGNGLSNMQFRANQIKGNLKIENINGSFTVQLSLPYPL